jgi:hypothetical protein
MSFRKTRYYVVVHPVVPVPCYNAGYSNSRTLWNARQSVLRAVSITLIERSRPDMRLVCASEYSSCSFRDRAMVYDYELTVTVLRQILWTKKNAGNMGYLRNAVFISREHLVLWGDWNPGLPKLLSDTTRERLLFSPTRRLPFRLLHRQSRLDENFLLAKD